MEAAVLFGVAAFLVALLAAALRPALGGEPAQQAGASLIGRVVTEVRLEAPADAFRGRAERRYAMSVLGVPPGSRLTREAVRRGIQDLYRTGKWRGVTVEGVPVGDDRVVLRLVLEPVERVGRVRFEGPRIVTRAELERVIQLAPGREFRPDAVARATRAIQDYLDRIGYPDAVVIATSRPFGEPYEREVTFTLTPNEPCRLTALRFEGAPGLAEAELRRAARLEPGDRCSRVELDAAVDRLKRRYRERDYLEAVVSQARLDYGPERRTATATVAVRAGERIALVFQGHRAFSSRRLRAALDLGEQPDLSSEGLSLLADRLVTVYRERGYAWAAASVRAEPQSSAPQGSGRRLVFRIVEGPKMQIVRVEFRGNAQIPARRLRDQMVTRPRAGFGLLASGTFRQAEFEEDLEAIRIFYRQQGVLDVRIADADFRFSPDRRRMWITITVDEGPRYVLVGLDLAGAEAIPAETLRRGLPLAPGRPFSLAAVDQAVEWIVQQYATRGYLEASVVPDVALEPSPPSARVRFVITEGLKVEVGEIIYRGNFYTRTRVLQREMTVRSGAPYNPAAVLESQRNIGRLGLFRNVTVRPADEAAGPVPAPLSPTELAPAPPAPAPTPSGPFSRDLLVTVEEAGRVDLSFGFDYSLEVGLRGFGEVTDRSLFGTDRSVTLRALAGTEESLYALEYRQPYLFDVRLGGRIALTNQDREEENFSFRRRAVTTSIQRDLRRDVKASLAYEFESTTVFDVAPGTVINPRDIGTVQIGALRPVVVWDRRDDPFNPTRGFLNTLSMEVANRAFVSEVEFVRLLASSAWFFPLERTRRVVLGLALRAGYALPYGASDAVPLIRRFFLGGATTVRGFDRDDISPRGADGAPTGGTVSFNENVELRFPLPFGFGGAVFLDAGNVFLDEASVDFFDQRASYGVGLRYLTPVGPIRFDYGRKVDRKPGESADRFHFSIGYVF
jgi:outer membrane protein insertion porin family